MSDHGALNYNRVLEQLRTPAASGDVRDREDLADIVASQTRTIRAMQERIAILQRHIAMLTGAGV